MDTRDRFRGCMLGLAAGDALGTAVEFCPPGTFAPVTDMRGDGPFGLKAGEWTDDTSMALCLAESLIAKGEFDPVDQMQRYLAWWREGHLSSTGSCFDIGRTTARALRQYELTGDPFSGPTDPHSAGNGSLMRLAPVPMFFFREPARAIELAGESSRTTHGAQTCVDACRYLAALIVGAYRASPRRSYLRANTLRQPRPGRLIPCARRYARWQRAHSGPRRQIRSSAQAMWCAPWRPLYGPLTNPRVSRTAASWRSTSVMTPIRPAQSTVNWPEPTTGKVGYRISGERSLPRGS